MSMTQQFYIVTTKIPLSDIKVGIPPTALQISTDDFFQFQHKLNSHIKNRYKNDTVKCNNESNYGYGRNVTLHKIITENPYPLNVEMVNDGCEYYEITLELCEHILADVQKNVSLMCQGGNPYHDIGGESIEELIGVILSLKSQLEQSGDFTRIIYNVNY